jgi:hypothetical protein
MTHPPFDEQLLRQLFFPYLAAQTTHALQAGARFAYYTSASTALNILRERKLWLRNATTMNDFSEIAHGMACVQAAYNGPHGARLKALLDTCFDGAAQELETRFNSWLPLFQVDTYMICVSLHTADEDKLGRLSMWRAYGGSSGVALVFNGGVMFRPSDALGAYSSPVLYADRDAFAVEFGRLIDGLQAGRDHVLALGRDLAISNLFRVLRYAVLSTKHPGFREEQEWRAIASPSMHASAHTELVVEVVRGVPQTVLKIPLKNIPGENLTGLEVPEFLDRLIIGPCEFPLVTYRAFQQQLIDLGIPDPENRIAISDIPLRHL